MKKLLMSCAAGIVLAGSAQVSQAVNIATFQQAVSANQFVYTSGGVGGNGTLSSVSATIPVFFSFGSFIRGVTSGSPTLNTTYSANLTISGTSTNTGGSQAFSSFPFDRMTFSFVGSSTDAATVAAGLANKLLLGGSSGSLTIPGAGGNLSAPPGQSSTFSASNTAPGSSGASPQFVIFSSGVINLTGITDQAFGLSFSNDTPSNSFTPLVPGNPFSQAFLNSFNATGTGTFSANTTVPEPGTVALAGSLLIGSVFSLRRRRNRQ